MKRLSPEKIRKLAAVAREVDAEEGPAIREQAREVFRRHEEIRELIDSLKAIRHQRHFSLEHVARLSGISKPNLSRLENSTHSAPTLETLQRYAKALGKAIHLRLAAA